jgi:hypothetical protein
MARGSTAAQTGAQTGNNLATSLSSNLSPLYGELQPALASEAAAPEGINPTDLAAMNTAAKQTAGGATAGATGRGSLLAARTRNAGGAQAAIGNAARSGAQAESQATLDTGLANQKLKQQQRSQGLSGLEGLYGEDISGTTGALGAAAANVNANTGAENASYDWATDLLNPLLGAANQGAATGAKIAGP